MSTEIPPDRLRWLDPPDGVRVRPRPRDEPPEKLLGPPKVNYPARDGRPMSDNTLQDQWIDRIKGGLATLYRDDPDVFVASNLMWYPVKGNNRRRLAPDVMVAFGRPKGYRKSYVVHRERRIPPHVVFEILSPGNRRRVMDFKRKIYELYGVEEYYVFDPYKIELEAWIREDDAFRLIAESSGWVSPRMGIRFELGADMTIFAPDGRPFLDHAEVARQRDEHRAEAERAVRRAGRAERRAEAERHRADEQSRLTEAERHRAEAERDRAEAERHRADRLAARLRELGLEPDE